MWEGYNYGCEQFNISTFFYRQYTVDITPKLKLTLQITKVYS